MKNIEWIEREYENVIFRLENELSDKSETYIPIVVFSMAGFYCGFCWRTLFDWIF